MISIQDQQKLFIEISKKLPYEIVVYAIGGTAMMFLGFKEATLDVDLVFTKKEDRIAFKKAAKLLGYKETDARVVYGLEENRPEIISLGDARLDLFLLDVIDFTFSKAMQERARDIHQFGENLILKIADVNDIIIMKCATRRLKDEDDIRKIMMEKDIKLDILVEEAQNQVSLGKETAILQLGTLLGNLRDKHKIKIPKEMLNKLFGLLKKQAERKMKKT